MMKTLARYYVDDANAELLRRAIVALQELELEPKKSNFNRRARLNLRIGIAGVREVREHDPLYQATSV